MHFCNIVASVNALMFTDEIWRLDHATFLVFAKLAMLPLVI